MENTVIATRKTKAPNLRRRKELIFYSLMMVIPIIQVIIFYFIINLNSIFLSFKNYSVLSGYKVTKDGFTFNLFDMLINTLLYTFGTAFVSTLVPCVVAYLIATYDKFVFSKIVYDFVIVTMILPIIGAAPSTIEVLRFLNYYDSIVGIWLFNFNFLVGIHFLIFYDAFRGLSKTYKEAAEIDGASQFRNRT